MNYFTVLYFPQNHAKLGNLPAAGHANYRIVNVAPCGINLSGKNLTNGNLTLSYAQVSYQ